MNNKAQLAGIGIFITIAIAVIVGAILLQAAAPSVASMNTILTVNNESLTLPAAPGNVTLKGQATFNHILTNRTSGTPIPASNFTVYNDVLVNGQLVSILRLLDGNFSGNVVNVSYTYESFGYANDGGTRAIIGLVLIFSAIAIFVVVLTPVGEAIRDLI